MRRQKAEAVAEAQVSVCFSIRFALGLALTSGCSRVVQMKRVQAARERERAAQADQLKRKQIVLEKARAALLAKQHKAEHKTEHKTEHTAQPKPSPKASRGRPPPRSELPAATRSAPAVVTLPFRLCDPHGHYALLGLSPVTFKAIPSDEVIRDARIEQLQIWHPDREGGQHERAQRINKAYELLATGASLLSARSSGSRPTDGTYLPLSRGTPGRLPGQGVSVAGSPSTLGWPPRPLDGFVSRKQPFSCAKVELLQLFPCDLVALDDRHQDRPQPILAGQPAAAADLLALALSA
jgi:hypothetical protein